MSPRRGLEIALVAALLVGGSLAVGRVRAVGLIRQSDRVLRVEPDGRKAAELARQAIRLAPGNPDAWHALAAAADRRRDWPTVIVAASRFLQIAPPDPPGGPPDRLIVGGYLERARQQIELGRPSRASEE